MPRVGDCALSQSTARRQEARREDPEGVATLPRTFANHNDVAQDAELLGRAGSQCDRDENETKGDSDRGESAEWAGSGEVLGDPHEASRDEDADSPDGADTEAGHEC